MSNPLYVRLRDTAKRLLTQQGKAVTFTRTVQGAFDPATGSTTTTTETVDGVGVVLPYGLITRFGTSEQAGTVIQQGDRKMIYNGPAPAVDDLYGDERVVAVDPLDPDESGGIIYTLQLRK